MTNSNNYKAVSIALGVGLAILWIAALSSPYTPGWLTWLDGVGALCAFIIAGTNQDYDTRSKRMTGPLALCLGLFALWAIGLATGAPGWLAWWTFAFACAFLVFGVAAGGARSLEQPTDQAIDQSTLTKSKESDEDRFRHTG